MVAMTTFPVLKGTFRILIDINDSLCLYCLAVTLSIPDIPVLKADLMFNGVKYLM